MRGGDGKYHMVAAQLTDGCGIFDYKTNSEVVHAISASPAGPYTFSEVIFPRYAHEPNLVPAPDGSVAMYFVWNRNASGPAPTPKRCSGLPTGWPWDLPAAAPPPPPPPRAGRTARLAQGMAPPPCRLDKCRV